MRTALIVGISGTTGKALLHALLNNRAYKRVIVFTRRENRRLKNIHMKKVLVDFANIDNYRSEMEGVDDVFCLLGTDYINTLQLEDAPLFEYEYPMQLAKAAKAAGIPNFFLVNSTRARLNAGVEKLKLRARLEEEIGKLGFENYSVFRVNGVKEPVNLENGMYITKRNFARLINRIGMGLLDRLERTPANLLASKMIQVALTNPLDQREFHPKDY